MGVPPRAVASLLDSLPRTRSLESYFTPSTTNACSYERNIPIPTATYDLRPTRRPTQSRSSHCLTIMANYVKRSVISAMLFTPKFLAKFFACDVTVQNSVSKI